MNNIPALSIPLTGKALIEASAGTGKTWTLTGILLRLLLEEAPNAQERLPRQIIATTFTRKAAAEMRRRIQARFDSFLLLARQLSEAYQQDNALLNDDEGLSARIEALLSVWTENGEQALAEAAKDAINRHLLLSAATQGLSALIALLRRCDARSQDIDELYIGTLDGLCQRWLAEFSLETGGEHHLELLEDTQQQAKISDLAHGHLRHFYQNMSAEDFVLWRQTQPKQENYQRLIDALSESQNFADIALEALPDVSAELATIEAERAELQQSAEYQSAYQALCVASEAEISVLSAWWRENALKVLKKEGIENHHQDIDFSALIQRLQTQAPSVENLNTEDIERLTILLNPEQSPLRKQSKEDKSLREQFYSFALIQALQVLFSPMMYRQKEWQELQSYQSPEIKSRYSALEYIRKHLPDALERSGQITFSEKLARLNRALAGEQGSVLARYISHRYPIILVDESQDLNAAQAQLLEHLHFQHLAPYGLLLLVGDPKQAIYRFRGGDVQNYLRLKTHFSPDECYALSHSFRSAPNLIEGLNQLYGQNDESKKLAEGIYYEMMQSSAKAERSIVNADGSTIGAPIHFYQINSADEEMLAIVELVKLLTSSHSPYAYQQSDGSLSPIQAQDILILLRSNDKLKALQSALQAQQIAVEFDKASSVFENEIASEIGFLLQAMYQPQQTRIINRLLSGVLFSQNQAELERLQAISAGEMSADKQELTLEALNIALQKANEQWQAQQPLSALQGLLSAPLNHGKSIWEHLASFPSPQRERYLLDLRSIQQMIADRGSKLPPAQLLHWWQQALAEPPQHEWAKATPLPSQNALRLMTIHAAKGLEAPVVIVGGLGKLGAQEKDIYTFYNAEGINQLSVLPKNEQRKKQLKQEQEEELARLLYVALTRPAELLFVGMAQNKDKKYPFLPLNSLNPLSLSSAYHQILPQLSALHQGKKRLTAPQSKENPVLLNQSYPKRAFKGWYKSSFSALTRQMDKQVQDTQIALPDFAYSEDTSSAERAQINDAAQAFQLSFPRGTRAGSFLHEVLETLDTQDFHNYQQILKRFTRLYVLPEEWVENPELRQWLENISQSPLISSTCLAQLSAKQCRKEMSFTLALKAEALMPFAQLNALFAKWGKAIQLPERQSMIRFLRGEIDLCYEYAGRYYVLDYKSNHLGNSAQDYSLSALEQAMDEHHYWLQALIYQTALHRWLKQRLPDYQAEKHLGAVEYFFVRACGLGAESDGHLRIEIPLEILLAFDALLG